MTRKVVHNTRPSFRFSGGSGHKTNTEGDVGGCAHICEHREGRGHILLVTYVAVNLLQY